MGRAGLAIGGVALIVVGGAIGFGWLWPSTAEATATMESEIRDVEIDNGSGYVTVRAEDVERATVRQVFRYRWDRPGDAYSVDGDTLVLGGCGGFCSVDYELVVPRGTEVGGENGSGDITLTGVGAVDVHAGSGDVRVTGGSGPVDIDASSGHVRLSDLAQDVTVRASSGDVTGEDLRGKVDVEASSGDIELRLAVPRDVRASASSGDIELTMPSGAYRVEGSSDSGNRDIEVDQVSSAEHLLRLDSSSGDVTVEAA
ncbi:DUF4097 family beta strand repeat-containing protein [Qaidamihabitans albus]|uniref:DUF4097 family beta strand repeat-containing protein n=1 Tax=Qaidamihabitans albus TaxID=2795733 RepID=UPI0018F1656F|nr:DUF4097 family beta strand repeat-containing protein [Qaidamihabitans albus]